MKTTTISLKEYINLLQFKLKALKNAKEMCTFFNQDIIDLEDEIESLKLLLNS